MLSFLHKVLTLPNFDDDLDIYIARMLRTVLVFVAGMSVLYTGLNVWSDPGNALRYGMQFLFIAATLTVMGFLLQARQPRVAALILVSSTWLIFTLAAYSGGGVLSSAYMGYLVVLTVAGLVAVSHRWTVFMAFLCAASGYALLYAENNGLLPASSVVNNGQSIWLDSLIYFGLVAALQILAARMVIDSLKRARIETEHKKEAENREKKRAQLLRTVIELGKDVTQAANLDWCLKKIHQSIQKGLDFDRVGLFLYDANQKTIQGTYGTDRQGNMEDTSWFQQNAEEYESWQIALRNPDGYSMIKNYTAMHNDLSPDSEMYGVSEHITLAAWSGLQPIALITVDNAISKRPISEEKVEALRLFAGYAGLAINNARNIETLNHELESFSYSVSHDLRSPLRAVVGFSKILLTDFSEEINADGQQYLQKINENGKKMGLLIDDLLSFSRVGRQPLRIKKIDLKPIVHAVIKNIEERHPGQTTEWIIDDLPPCQADFNLMQMALANLLENAFTYTRESKNPRIEIGYTTQAGEPAYFVQDNGIGFDMQYANKIFRVFHRLHHDDEYEGTGVGLAIVHRILQRHGGKIWAHAQPGQGATFFFSLP